MKIKALILSVFFNLLIIPCVKLYSQFVFPERIERKHPRLLSEEVSKEQIIKEIQSSVEVKKAYDKFKRKISKYVNKHQEDPEWMVSRLQMYWKRHATDVYINGEVYSHADGNAPLPTVRFTGARDYVTNYKTPKLEDILPYSDDERGLWLQNKTTNDWEWTHQGKTGRIVENINKKIIEYARDAALIYFIEGDTKYAKFATDLFDVYMHGIYYRNVPYDLEQGHMQKLVGYTSFQVIKEGVVRPLVNCYDYLYEYLIENAEDRMEIYSTSFKKMAEQIIKNGVPNNNWNLLQANIVIQVAFILEDDSFYKDGKGCQYYLDRVFNKTEERQWSITKLMNHGYDMNNGIWEECAGYSMLVTNDFTELVGVMGETLDIDVLPYMPILPKAINVLPQYLFPNKYVVAFGDTHYGKISNSSMLGMVENAKKFGKTEQEKEYTALAHLVNEINGVKPSSHKKHHAKDAFKALLSGKECVLDEAIVPADINDYVTSTFYAPNVSWLVQRNGFDAKNGLMISQAGSLGNHVHSNGIAMELYGENYVLGVEGGKGSSYFQPDYLEYYSQFPAHNTVVVNGVSQYKAMRSTYPFKVNALYPESEKKLGYYPYISFSDLYFLEPKTNADQNRIMSIVRTGETTGYYIDIFRSKCKEGNDKYHDYFYHNLGQSLSLSDASSNEEFLLTTSEKLSSADGDIIAYDYIKNKQSIQTNKDFNAQFQLNIPGEGSVLMNMWMKGENNREIFKVTSPKSAALKGGMVSDDIANAPLYTTIVRNKGEAWEHPFISIFEPFTSKEGSSILSIIGFEDENKNDAFSGVKVTHKSGREDYIFSSYGGKMVEFEKKSTNASYALVGTEKNKDWVIFMGNGKEIHAKGYSITATKSGNAILEMKEGQLLLHNEIPVKILYKGQEKSFEIDNVRKINF